MSEYKKKIEDRCAQRILRMCYETSSAMQRSRPPSFYRKNSRAMFCAQADALHDISRAVGMYGVIRD